MAPRPLSLLIQTGNVAECWGLAGLDSFQPSQFKGLYLPWPTQPWLLFPAKSLKSLGISVPTAWFLFPVKSSILQWFTSHLLNQVFLKILASHFAHLPGKCQSCVEHHKMKNHSFRIFFFNPLHSFLFLFAFPGWNLERESGRCLM